MRRGLNLKVMDNFDSVKNARFAELLKKYEFEKMVFQFDWQRTNAIKYLHSCSDNIAMLPEAIAISLCQNDTFFNDYMSSSNFRGYPFSDRYGLEVLKYLGRVIQPNNRWSVFRETSLPIEYCLEVACKLEEEFNWLIKIGHFSPEALENAKKTSEWNAKF